MGAFIYKFLISFFYNVYLYDLIIKYFVYMSNYSFKLSSLMCNLSRIFFIKKMAHFQSTLKVNIEKAEVKVKNFDF